MCESYIIHYTLPSMVKESKSSMISQGSRVNSCDHPVLPWVYNYMFFPKRGTPPLRRPATSRCSPGATTRTGRMGDIGPGLWHVVRIEMIPWIKPKKTKVNHKSVANHCVSVILVAHAEGKYEQLCDRKISSAFLGLEYGRRVWH